jgi:hypothetical protein
VARITVATARSRAPVSPSRWSPACRRSCAHGLSPIYQSLAAGGHRAGAATTVALSFLFVLARDMRAAPATDTRVVSVPAPLRLVLRVVGLAGWGWIMVQGVAGGSSDAAVAGLFLWVYGWVGVAMLSALVAPVWEWVDPFATLHDMLAWALRRLGVRGWVPGERTDAVRLAGGGRLRVLRLAGAGRGRGNATLAVVSAATPPSRWR